MRMIFRVTHSDESGDISGPCSIVMILDDHDPLTNSITSTPHFGTKVLAIPAPIAPSFGLMSFAPSNNDNDLVLSSAGGDGAALDWQGDIVTVLATVTVGGGGDVSLLEEPYGLSCDLQGGVGGAWDNATDASYGQDVKTAGGKGITVHRMLGGCTESAGERTVSQIQCFFLLDTTGIAGANSEDRSTGGNNGFGLQDSAGASRVGGIECDAKWWRRGRRLLPYPELHRRVHRSPEDRRRRLHDDSEAGAHRHPPGTSHALHEPAVRVRKRRVGRLLPVRAEDRGRVPRVRRLHPAQDPCPPLVFGGLDRGICN